MKPWACGDFTLPLGEKTYVMGVVNVTPDSFSGDGIFDAQAAEHALRLIDEGADILDIGGESTRPGATPVAAEDELKRILPVLEALANRVAVPISVDTTKAIVAGAAVEAGASIINDISGGSFDAEMFEVLASTQCGCVFMHLRGTPQTMGWSRQQGAASGNVIAEASEFLRSRTDEAQVAGIDRTRIALDPGFGFGKSMDENLELLRRGDELARLGFPLLIGTSRKSTIGKLLNDAPVSERLWGTAATVALAIGAGYDIVRVHDVHEMAQVVRVSDAILRRPKQV